MLNASSVFVSIIPHHSRKPREVPNVKGRDRAVLAGPVLLLGHNRSETTQTVEVEVAPTAGRSNNDRAISSTLNPFVGSVSRKQRVRKLDYDTV